MLKELEQKLMENNWYDLVMNSNDPKRWYNHGMGFGTICDVLENVYKYSREEAGDIANDAVYEPLIGG